jgi:acetyltransferase
MSLEELFYPRGVAVIGSASRGKLGYELIKQIVGGGYKHVYAVNPKGQGAFGTSGYTAVAAIEQPVDLAVIASPAATVAEVLADCGKAEVKTAVIITAGFSEVGNAAGEKSIVKVAKRNGIRFCGPNCAGIINTKHQLYPTLETRPLQGEVAFVTQSGALGGAVLSWAEEQGVGFSKFVSYGNGADLDEIDFLDYFVDDPETKVVALYIETVSDGRAFMTAAHRLTRHKPLVVIKAGRSVSGQRATLSHTGSMAGSDAVYAAALRRCGAIRVDTIEEMFDLCRGFVTLPPLKGRLLLIVTNSGGPGVLAADRAEGVGLHLNEPTSNLQKKLSSFLSPVCSLKNPVDLTVEGTEDDYRRTLGEALSEYDAALAINVGTPFLDSTPLAHGICDAAAKTKKPIAANFMAGKTVAASLPYLEQHGIPNFLTGERAVTVLAQMANYFELQRQSLPLPEPPSAAGTPLNNGNDLLLEPAAMAWLHENGFPIPEFRFAVTPEDAMRASSSLGYPVVMKVVSHDIIHKSEVGGVITDIRTEDEVVTAFHTIEQRAADRDFQGAIIYPMISETLEILIGLSRDPQFGPVIAFGMGGIYTEVFQDISLRIAPLDYEEANAMIQELKAFPILKGIRGQPTRDLDAVAKLLVKFSRLPFRYPEIEEIDLNPVFLLPKGLLVGDVRVIRSRNNI